MSNILTKDEKCTYCREYGNLPCEKCDEKLNAKISLAMEQPKKYIKVNTAERLPNKTDWYYTEEGLMYFITEDLMGRKNFWEDELSQLHEIIYWLEEVPDRESELIEMLEKSSKTIKSLKLSMLAHPDYTEESEFDDLTSIARDQENEIDSLIQSVKQPK